ncbi:hypothetical protein BDR22DRAFT_281095 [Usnea florida]
MLTNMCCCEDFATSFHPCAKCLYISRCTEMHEDEQGFRVCERCGKQEEQAPKTGRHGTSLPKNTHAGHKAMFYRLNGHIRSEAEIRQVTYEIGTRSTLPAWESIQQYALKNGEWYDDYCGISRRESTTSKNPFQPSVDGVFPYAIVDGEICYHAPGNLVVTSLYVAFLKNGVDSHLLPLPPNLPYLLCC